MSFYFILIYFIFKYENNYLIIFRDYYLNKLKISYYIIIKNIHLGIGDWAQSPIPNPQSPIPNPHLKLIKFNFTFFCLN